MRIGLAGCGRIGARHARVLESLTNVKEVVIADIDPARAEAIAQEFEVTSTPHPGDLFTSGLDGLVIATPTHTHEALVTWAVEAGLPTLCEKPLSDTAEGAIRIIAAAARRGVPVQVGFQRRSDPGYIAAREAFQSGRLGWLHTLRACTFDAAPPPAAFIAGSGGLFHDCGVHDFDAIRWVTGREVASVLATGANRGAAFFSEHGDVDTAVAMLTLDDGTLATVSLGRYNGQGYDVRLEVLGSSGSVAVGLDQQLPLVSAEPGVDFPTGQPWHGFADRFRSAYRAELQAFVDLVRGQGENPCPPGNALEAFYVAEAAELSRREQRSITIAEVRR